MAATTTVSFGQLNSFVSLTQKASDSAVQSLTQEERKTVLSAFEAFKTHENFDISQELWVSLRQKLSATPPPRTPSYLWGTVNTCGNYLGSRISSEQIRKAANALYPATNRQEAVEHFHGSTSRDVKRLISNNDVFGEDILLGYIQESLQATPPTQDCALFCKDYQRQSVLLTIRDANTDVFVGSRSGAGEERAAHHTQGMKTVFSEQEDRWRIMVQAAVSQTPFNALLMREVSCINSLGADREVSTSDGAVLIKANGQAMEMTATVQLNKDASGRIQNVRITLSSPLPVDVVRRTTAKVGSGTRPKETETVEDRLGTVQATMNCTLSFDTAGKPVISDVSCSRIFDNLENGWTSID